MQKRLKTHPFADGAGSIGIAPGWRLEQQTRDSVVVTGPAGASLLLGQYRSTIQPAAVAFGAEQRFVVVENLSDPVAATQAMIDQALHQQGRRLRIQILERQRATGGQGMNAVTLHYRIHGDADLEGFGWFAAGPVGSGMGMLASSYAIAPPAHFKRLLPEMLAMWQSRKLNADVLSRPPLEMVEKMRTLEIHSRQIRELL